MDTPVELGIETVRESDEVKFERNLKFAEFHAAESASRALESFVSVVSGPTRGVSLGRFSPRSSGWFKVPESVIATEERPARNWPATSASEGAETVSSVTLQFQRSSRTDPGVIAMRVLPSFESKPHKFCVITRPAFRLVDVGGLPEAGTTSTHEASAMVIHTLAAMRNFESPEVTGVVRVPVAIVESFRKLSYSTSGDGVLKGGVRPNGTSRRCCLPVEYLGREQARSASTGRMLAAQALRALEVIGESGRFTFGGLWIPHVPSSLPPHGDRKRTNP